MERYIKAVEEEIKILCESYNLFGQGTNVAKEEGRTAIVTYVEGRKGHYRWSPENMTAKIFADISRLLDVEFEDGTKGIAQMSVIYEGKLLFIWKIVWERDSTYAEW